MPIRWNATADAKLFVCVMKAYELKISGGKLEEIAALMGEDCTASAVTRRLIKLRKTATLDSGPSTQVRVRGTPSRARKPRPATPRTKSVNGPAGKSDPKGAPKGKLPVAASNDEEAMGAYDDEDDEEVFALPAKRLFKTEIEAGVVEVGRVGKKVKEEVVKEEEEEGFKVVVTLEV